MRNTLIVLGAIFTMISFLATACATPGTATTTAPTTAIPTTGTTIAPTTTVAGEWLPVSPEWLLASIDTDNPALPTDDVIVQYFARYLDSLEAKTTNSRMDIADIVIQAWTILQNNGNNDSLQWVIEQLDDSIPDGTPKVDWDLKDAVLTLRMQ